jgi:hypothetical protein
MGQTPLSVSTDASGRNRSATKPTFWQAVDNCGARQEWATFRGDILDVGKTAFET